MRENLLVSGTAIFLLVTSLLLYKVFNSFVCSLTQEFTTSMYLRQEWKDRRLAHLLDGTLPVKGKDLQKIWRPDTYFTNNNDYKLYEDNQLALISKYGDVYYSAR